MANIQYVFSREHHVDSLYGTGSWVKGEVKSVPDDVAARMLKHKDVYRQPEGNVDAPAVEFDKKPKRDDEEERSQDMRDSINTMDKKALELFAKTHFNVDLDRRKSVADLRNAVTGLFDQFGTE